MSFFSRLFGASAHQANANSDAARQEHPADAPQSAGATDTSATLAAEERPLSRGTNNTPAPVDHTLNSPQHIAQREALASVRKNPITSRVFGPIGGLMVPFAKRAPELVETLHGRGKLHKELDRLEAKPNLTADESYKMIQDTVKLGSHARAQDLEAAGTAFEHIRASDNKYEVRLVKDYNDLINKRDEALSTLGLPKEGGALPEPAAVFGDRNKEKSVAAPQAAPAGKETFPFLEPVHRGKEAALLARDLALRMVGSPSLLAKSSPGWEDSKVAGFDLRKDEQRLYREKWDSQVRGLPQAQREAYENTFLKEVETGGKHVSSRDRDLAAYIVETRRWEVREHSNYLYEVADQLKGYDQTGDVITPPAAMPKAGEAFAKAKQGKKSKKAPDAAGQEHTAFDTLAMQVERLKALASDVQSQSSPDKSPSPTLHISGGLDHDGPLELPTQIGKTRSAQQQRN